jgi:hypothetical protein
LDGRYFSSWISAGQFGEFHAVDRRGWETDCSDSSVRRTGGNPVDLAIGRKPGNALPLLRWPPPQATLKVIPQSMDDLILQYRASSRYTVFAPKTQRNHRAHLECFFANFGSLSIPKLPRAFRAWAQGQIQPAPVGWAEP